MLNTKSRLPLHVRHSVRLIPVAAGSDAGADQSGGRGGGSVARVAARDDAEVELLAARSLPHARTTRRQSVTRRARAARCRRSRRLRNGGRCPSARLLTRTEPRLCRQRKSRRENYRAWLAAAS